MMGSVCAPPAKRSENRCGNGSVDGSGNRAFDDLRYGKGSGQTNENGIYRSAGKRRRPLGSFVHTEPRWWASISAETKGVVKTPVKERNFLWGMACRETHAGDWHRMVSLLGLESYDKMKNEAGERLAQGSFAENITTEGIVLYELPVGTVLQIGETVHEVTQIGKKCHTGCQIKSLVGDCVMPREGIFTKLLSSGTIREGDPIRIIKKGSAE